MKIGSGLTLFALLTVLAGCDPVPVQYPPGSIPYPNVNNASVAQPQPQISGCQRGLHAWGSMMEGVAMGSSIGGPYGAGAGLIIGLLKHAVTFDSECAQLHAKIGSEQRKDEMLEAAIEQELERQRALENQIANVSGNGTQSVGLPPAPVKQAPSPMAKQSAPLDQPPEKTVLASLGKPPAAVAPSSPFKNVDVRDTNGDGIPDLWIYYNPRKPGEIIRQEEATKGDGRVDTWSTFKDGKLIRREVDTKGLGRPDTFFSYDGDKIAREERDETGQGRVTYRAIYEGGRLAKVEKDLSDQGRPDLWVYYDTAKEIETVVKEERDLNGDGVADLWSYYENGRLVRRDVNTIGLELLSKQEQSPVPIANLK